MVSRLGKISRSLNRKFQRNKICALSVNYRGLFKKEMLRKLKILFGRDHAEILMFATHICRMQILPAKKSCKIATF